MRPGAPVVGPVKELLDVAADLFEDGEGRPDVGVPIGEGLRLALGGDRVEDAVAAPVEYVVLAEHPGIVGLGVGQRQLGDLEAIGGEQFTILAAQAGGGFDEGFAQLLDLVAGKRGLEPLDGGLALAVDDEVAGEAVGVGVGDIGDGGHF